MRTQEHVSQQSQSGHGIGQTATSSSELPDINAETYPYETVLHLLDQVAYFNMYSVANPALSNVGILAQGQPGHVIGIRVNEILHRFDVTVQPPTLEKGLRAVNVVGEPIAGFEHRWMMIPHDFRALPGHEPPPTRLDPSQSQRFTMLDAICRFGNGEDGFHGFGTGRTFPAVMNGKRQLLAAAVGTILEGFGNFHGLVGTYTYSGKISPDSGFIGNLFCRVMDPEGKLRTEKKLPALQPRPHPEPDITYIVFRGQKRDRTQKTRYSFGPDGQVNGLLLGPQIRLLQLDSAFTTQGNLGSVSSVGQVIGSLNGIILFNPLNPGAPGTVESPIPFSDYNDYTFFAQGGDVVGGFGFNGGAKYIADSYVPEGGEGRTFNLSLVGAPRQAALRFGGFGPIVNGSGMFTDIEGLLMHNSAVGIAPHALSTVFIARLCDPDGKYRVTSNEGWG